jgi:hypothetical protein
MKRMHGWVGGWGTADFCGGFSNETKDGGNNWANADEIGRFLNRFRFFHKPRLVGYASGDTVYKYDDSSAVPNLLAAARAEPFLCPARRLNYSVKPGEANLRIDVWDRFGTSSAP